MILSKSTDNGELYPESAVDNPTEAVAEGRFEAVEVNDRVILTPEQCCGGDGNVLEVLLRAGQARML